MSVLFLPEKKNVLKKTGKIMKASEILKRAIKKYFKLFDMKDIEWAFHATGNAKDRDDFEWKFKQALTQLENKLK